MKNLRRFIQKSLSVLRLGKKWLQKLLGSFADAARSISYIETVNPTQADTLHQEIKRTDETTIKQAFEFSVRAALSRLHLGKVLIGIDVTEDPYWGKSDQYNTRAGAHEKHNESWQYVNLSIVEPHFIPLMSLPYRQTDSLDDLVIDLLNYLKTLHLRVQMVLFDRGFYHGHLIDFLENRQGKTPWPYLIFVPKNKAIQKFIEQTEGSIGIFRHTGEYTKEKTVWQPETTIVIFKGASKNKKGEPVDWCFATNQKADRTLLTTYRKRWNIETGFRIHDEARIKSKSSHPLIRFFYHLIGMLFILMWRLRNHIGKYIVFKRYLKEIELFFSPIVRIIDDPPIV